jgi:hypothetical protein
MRRVIWRVLVRFLGLGTQFFETGELHNEQIFLQHFGSVWVLSLAVVLLLVDCAAAIAVQPDWLWLDLLVIDRPQKKRTAQDNGFVLFFSYSEEGRGGEFLGGVRSPQTPTLRTISRALNPWSVHVSVSPCQFMSIKPDGSPARIPGVPEDTCLSLKSSV